MLGKRDVKDYDDAGSERSSSSEDSDGIVMPEGQPPSRMPIMKPLPGQPPLPLGPPPTLISANIANSNVYYPANMPDQSQIRALSEQTRMHQSGAPSKSSPPGQPPSKPPSAIISAEPVLRDFKKEATTFVPNAIRKKQAAERAKAVKSGLPNTVNAAPGASSQDGVRGNRVGLMDSLQPHLQQRGEHDPSFSTDNVKNKQQDEYQQFLGDIQDLL